MEQPPANRPSVNPYRPPPILDDPSSTLGPQTARWKDGQFDTRALQPPIEFVGQVDQGDLDRYLKNDGDLGISFPLTLLMSVALAVLVAITVGGIQFAPLCVCLLSFVAVGLIVSSKAYRRSVFVAAHPDWNQPQSGRLAEDGLTIRQRNTSTRYASKAWTAVVIGSDLIAIEVGLPKGRMILITPTMMQSLDDWQRLSSFAEQLRRHMIAESAMGRVSEVRSVIRDRHRTRTAPVPEDAIGFAGALTTSDVAQVASRTRTRRPLRARMLRMTLLFLAVGFVFETLKLTLPAAPIWKILLIVYALATAIWFYALNRRAGSIVRKIQHLLGYVSQRGITTDVGLVVTEVQWHDLASIDVQEDRITLAHRFHHQHLHLRSDMFADDMDWQRAKQWIITSTKLSPTAGSSIG